MALAERRADVIPGAVDALNDEAEHLGRATWKVHVLVKVVLAGETGMQEVSARLPVWIVQILRDMAADDEHGRALPKAIDVPVLVDPESGRIKRLDVDLLEHELEPYREHAQEVWRRKFGLLSPARGLAAAPKKLFRGLREVAGHLGDLAADIRSEEPPPEAPRPTPESHPPIDGVDYDTWLRALLAGTPVDGPAHAGWMALAERDPVVGVWYRWDVQHPDPG